ncbi:hypothetical protein J1605_012176 [Eschrichtius robustus]|uniref:Uncharacterized protein n=1 Tax=Eschrichtius robustus TaxID=9764 RepID=A0AB34GM63_ESCRO|nr:hypothetical protein J1605_012176 [Eschrichtius robustus]
MSPPLASCEEVVLAAGESPKRSLHSRLELRRVPTRRRRGRQLDGCPLGTVASSPRRPSSQARGPAPQGGGGGGGGAGGAGSRPLGPGHCGGDPPSVQLGTRQRRGQAQPGRYNRVGPRRGLGRRWARSRIAAGADRHWAAGDSEPAGHQPSQPRPTPELPPPSIVARRAGRDAPRDPYPGRWPPPPSPLLKPRRLPSDAAAMERGSRSEPGAGAAPASPVLSLSLENEVKA